MPVRKELMPFDVDTIHCVCTYAFTYISNHAVIAKLFPLSLGHGPFSDAVMLLGDLLD